ncbi:MAG TPA: bifunctional phosphoribosylaminoimidazolecarboxamide formyltransferase/IMP cyclohydrolase, partial [Kaistia sp.]|nr:bifunctional phosphoribosylaminoimidazolecarboxamide formyltransferase/IMP cyclohydrolase [Kaistia sp.]
MAVPPSKVALPELVPMKRALFSVSDSTGLLDFARALHERGVALVATGSTCKALIDAGLPATNVADVIGFPEILGGRVKTLHPKIHGGLLGIRNDPQHAAEMEEHGIEGFDLVAVNLYPFEKTI